MVQAISVLLNIALVLLIFVSISQWAMQLWRGRDLIGHGFLDSMVARRVRRRPFWTPAEALLMLGVMILITQVLLIVMIRKGWVTSSLAGGETSELTATGLVSAIFATSIGGLLAMAITLAWMRIFDRDARRQIGLTVSPGDIQLGLGGALMILPPVLLVSGLVNHFVPYEHPVLESLAKIATPGVFLATFVGTAVVTPLVEEFLVRGLLQGSLQGIADRDPADDSPWYARTYVAQQINSEAVAWKPRSFWPVLVSSIVFAWLHQGQGAAPIPLFVLALGLGFLYRQTGSLTPSIVVHMVLNGLTLVVEFLKLYSE